MFTTEPLFATVIAVAAGVEAWSPRTGVGGLLIVIAMVAAEAAQRTAADMRKEGLEVSAR